MKSVTSGLPRRFAASQAAGMIRNVIEARAICRAIALAVAAQLDSAVQFDDDAARRWEPSVDVACGLLRGVSMLLTETAGAPDDVNWVGPLNLLECLGAALWRSHAPSDAGADHELTHDELAALLAVAIRSLDVLVDECADAMARLAPAAAVEHADAQ
jgi:hypothetical protein